MSMEQAILEHAGALRELAAAIKSMGSVSFTAQPSLMTKEQVAKAFDVPVDLVQEEAHPPADHSGTAKVIAESISKRVEQVKATTEKADAVEPDAELEAAVTKVEEDSKALDYKTDVRPVLLALAKKAGQPALKDLLTKYGAATGDKLTADQFAGIVADANALIAG